MKKEFTFDEEEKELINEFNKIDESLTTDAEAAPVVEDETEAPVVEEPIVKEKDMEFKSIYDLAKAVASGASIDLAKQPWNENDVKAIASIFK
jgi:hypothetical protein